jgi:hypothetical protein
MVLEYIIQLLLCQSPSSGVTTLSFYITGETAQWKHHSEVLLLLCVLVTSGACLQRRS